MPLKPELGGFCEPSDRVCSSTEVGTDTYVQMESSTPSAEAILTVSTRRRTEPHIPLFHLPVMHVYAIQQYEDPGQSAAVGRVLNRTRMLPLIGMTPRPTRVRSVVIVSCVTSTSVRYTNDARKVRISAEEK